MFLNQFQNVGHALFSRGLVSSQSGNLSIRMGDRLIITRRGSNLGALQEKDLVETGINKNDRATPMASVELPVHRAIYQNTQARAIVHAHPTHVIAPVPDGKSNPFKLSGRILRPGQFGAGDWLGYGS